MGTENGERNTETNRGTLEYDKIPLRENEEGEDIRKRKKKRKKKEKNKEKRTIGRTDDPAATMKISIPADSTVSFHIARAYPGGVLFSKRGTE